MIKSTLGRWVSAPTAASEPSRQPTRHSTRRTFTGKGRKLMRKGSFCCICDWLVKSEILQLERVLDATSFRPLLQARQAHDQMISPESESDNSPPASYNRRPLV